MKATNVCYRQESNSLLAQPLISTLYIDMNLIAYWHSALLAHYMTIGSQNNTNLHPFHDKHKKELKAIFHVPLKCLRSIISYVYYIMVPHLNITQHNLLQTP